LLEDLRQGSVDAVVMCVTDFARAHRDDERLQAGVLVGSPAGAGWAVRQHDTRLRLALDEFMISLTSSPSWNRIVLTSRRAARA
jgi:hypothetical protein